MIFRYRFLKLFGVLVCLALPLYDIAQVSPSAKFSFNSGKDYDEISGRKAKLVTVTFTKDRFGNDNNAAYLHGSKYSYVNLGTYDALKPKTGTIALWFQIDGKNWSGAGHRANPILLTKNSRLEDFYEAYGIYYFLDFEKIVTATSVDSTCEVSLVTRDKVQTLQWHHVAIAFNDTSFSLYLDGALENRIRKKFVTTYLQSDSVMVGNTANEKNARFLSGSVDDIEFYDQVLTDKEIKDLYEAPNPNKNAIIFKWSLVVAGLLILLYLIFIYTRYRVRAAVKREKEKSEQANTALENELRIHRALMNPHFIFNCLNGLQDFILKNANEEANAYLIKFSQLLRKIMESNMSDSISLELELELLLRYIEIEGMRFEENITSSFSVDPSLVPYNTILPIMMIQPFVENAIWHGLLTKEGDKAILLTFERYQEKYIKCVIDDNGVGRKKNINTHKQKSLAIQFIKQRLELMNKIHDLSCSLSIEDKPEEKGTTVTIILPILNG